MTSGLSTLVTPGLNSIFWAPAAFRASMYPSRTFVGTPFTPTPCAGSRLALNITGCWESGESLAIKLSNAEFSELMYRDSLASWPAEGKTHARSSSVVRDRKSDVHGRNCD